MRLRAVLAMFALVACGSDDAAPTSTEPTTPPPGTSPAAPNDPNAPPTSEPPVIGTFPKDFVFGSAIAGFQVDMGCPSMPAAQCEDRNSDWYQWITTPRILDNPILFMSKDPPSKGPGFRELYEKDLDLAAGKKEHELGNGAVRLSIEWSRIFPKPTFGVSGHAQLKALASAENIAWYHQLFAAMKARGLKPFVTVSHYSLPLWIHDGNLCNQNFDDCVAQNKAGWGHPNRARIVNEIAKYAAFLGAEFGGEVDHWASLNEPFSAVVIAGYVVSSPMRSNPPGLSGPWMKLDAARTAASAMVEAHARIYDALKAYDTKDADGDGKKAEVGIVYPYSEIVPLTGNAQDAKAADDARYFFEDMFMDGVVEGRLDEKWDGKPTVRQDLMNRCDYVGMNYYFRFEAQRFDSPLSVVSPYLTFNMLREFDANRPKGIHAALMRLHQKYKKPIYVTETGTTQDDEGRGAAWVVQTLSEVRHAIKDGADVRGYFAWSLMDNYEWNHGMGMKFGLYQVANETKERAARDAAVVYGRIAKSRDVPAELETKYASFFP